jgi:hypothetical protein
MFQIAGIMRDLLHPSIFETPIRMTDYEFYTGNEAASFCLEFQDV